MGLLARAQVARHRHVDEARVRVLAERAPLEKNPRARRRPPAPPRGDALVPVPVAVNLRAQLRRAEGRLSGSTRSKGLGGVFARHRVAHGYQRAPARGARSSLALLLRRARRERGGDVEHPHHRLHARHRDARCREKATHIGASRRRTTRARRAARVTRITDSMGITAAATRPSGETAPRSPVTRFAWESTAPVRTQRSTGRRAGRPPAPPR